MKRAVAPVAPALLLAAIAWPVQATGGFVESSPEAIVTSTGTEGGAASPDEAPGSSAPGAGEEAGDGSGGRTPEARPFSDSGTTIHVDRMLRFSVERPEGFLVVPQRAAALAHFDPAPVASVFFARPIEGDGGGAPMEPPDLEVRVFGVGAGVPLETWLARAGIASAGSTVEPCRSAGASGLRVCQATLIFPGCSCFFLRGDRVYQTTAASPEGEAMAESFALLP